MGILHLKCSILEQLLIRKRYRMGEDFGNIALIKNHVWNLIVQRQKEASRTGSSDNTLATISSTVRQLNPYPYIQSFISTEVVQPGFRFQYWNLLKTFNFYD